MSADIDEAYDVCERITREQARNFSWGIRLLPAPKRRALSAVYAVARRIDDIGDGDLPADEKLRQLALARVGSTAPGEHLDDPVLLALDDAACRLPIPLDAFGELVDGCEMDVTGRSYDDLDQLVGYCRCVAGSIGRLSLGVFDPPLTGGDRARAAGLADALGVALQLTNILRDIREDLGNGRVYLPKRDLDLFDVEFHPARRIAGPARRSPRRARPVRGGAGLGLVRPRPGAARHARSAKRCVLRGDGGHLPRAARPHRRRSGHRHARARVAADSRQDPGRGPVAGQGPHVSGKAVVVGGGLAGITAALRLADAGQSVVLLEGRPRLGGAAFSFRRGELSIDNGQHVFLRCCDSYRWLMRRLGVEQDVVLQPRLDIPILRADGQRARLSRTAGVPAPAHLTAALARYRLLRPADRFRAVRGALALRRLDPGDASLDARTLGEFLRRHGQNDAIIGSLWGIVAVATLNLDPDEASLALAAKVFRTGLLDHADAADVGYAGVPLGDLHSTAAQRALDHAGVEVLLAHRVESIEPGATVHARGRDGARSFQADTVVLALPHRDAFAAVPALEQTPVAGPRASARRPS